MKTAKIMLFLVGLILMPAMAFPTEYGRARIGFLSGDVQIRTADIPQWLPAVTNTPLRDGDRVWVPEGARTEIQVLGGAFIRLDAVTSLDVISLSGNNNQLYMNGGRAYINNRRHGIDSIQIDTPLSSILCRDDSLAVIDVADSGATEVSLLRGEAFAETRNGKIRISPGATLFIREDLRAELYPLAAGGEWEAWNRDRDRILSRAGESLRYLPTELDEYAYDLDANGRWITTADYGYVWVPSVSVSLGWAPYRHGRWAWMGGSFIWISYEPWGWAPYHYGRWAFLGGRGWCWVPPRHGSAHWGPGYVGWVHTPTYVAWVPLAPGDTYYGHGDFGPGSVNINTITINIMDVHRHFRNIDVGNAVTTLHRDTFFHGKRSDFRISGNPFRQQNVGFGPPPVTRPDRASVSPVIRTIPAAKLPPPVVQKIQPEDIRRERRLVTDERSSVFTPERPVRQMRAIRRNEPRRAVREGSGAHPADAGRVEAGKEKPPLGTPSTPPQPSAIRPPGGRPEHNRLPLPPGSTAAPAPGEKPPAPVKPPKERKPRTMAPSPSTAPALAPPATSAPSSTTGTPPSGQPSERSRIRTAPAGISTVQQPGTVPATPTQGRSRTSDAQGTRIAPPSPTPAAGGDPQQIRKPLPPSSAPQPAAQPSRPQVQRPAAASPSGTQAAGQPVKVQRQQAPAPPARHEGQPQLQKQQSGQQSTVRQQPGAQEPSPPYPSHGHGEAETR